MYKSVLVVDDVELSREILKSAVLCAEEEVKLVAVENAYAAINKLRGKKFDLVIMDIMMPNGDGFELLNMISQLSIETKIIVISSLDRAVIDMMWKIGQLYELEIVSALEKPIDSKTLTDLVTNVFSLGTLSQSQQSADLGNINIFDFPVGVYYQLQNNAGDDRSVVGIDVCGNWSNNGDRSLLLSNHLLPDIATLSDKKLYNQVLIGKFLQEYREYFQSLSEHLSFTLHIAPDCFDDSFVYGCILELQEMNHQHELNLYIESIDVLENANETLKARLNQFVQLGIGLVLGTSDLTSETILRAKLQSVTQINVNAEGLSSLCARNDKASLELIVDMAEKEKINVLCHGVESANLSGFLTANGLLKQQGLLFSVPVSAENLKSELLKAFRGQLEGEV
ncbi:EAL domain-containing response regulator [Vibrio campbellii]|uniref:EAL domain-containing response regulator n=1 Tax=Vibrio campbellii TaxID=680 RepID=UPI0039098333